MAARETTLGLGAILVVLTLTACGGGDSGETIDPPLGKHVVFTSRESGRDQLYLADTGRPGVVLARLSEGLGKNESFEQITVGARGRWLAFSTYDDAESEWSLRFIDPLRPDRVQRWRMGGLSFYTDLGDIAWSADGARAAITVWGPPWSDPFLMLIDPATTATVFAEHGMIPNEVIGLPAGRTFAVASGTAVHVIDYSGAAPGVPVLRDTAPAGYAFGHWMKATPDGRYVIVPAHAADNTGLLRAVRVDGGGPSMTLTPALPTGTWVSLVGASTTAVVYAAGPVGGGQQRLYRVDLANPGVAVELTPAGFDGGFYQYTLSPDGAQVAYSTTAGPTTPVGVFSINVSLPGVATQRAGLPTGATTGYIDGFEFVQGGLGLLVARESGAIVPIEGQLIVEHELVRVGAHSDEGVLRIAGIFPSGANPGWQVCDDGRTLLVAERMQFPPGLGGVPETYPWLSEIHVARVDAPGTVRLTKGYEPWRGVGQRECLPLAPVPGAPD